MYEPSTNFWDIAIVSIAVILAGLYVYNKLFKPKNRCGGEGGGCSSCASSGGKK